MSAPAWAILEAVALTCEAIASPAVCADFPKWPPASEANFARVSFMLAISARIFSTSLARSALAEEAESAMPAPGCSIALPTLSGKHPGRAGWPGDKPGGRMSPEAREAPGLPGEVPPLG